VLGIGARLSSLLETVSESILSQIEQSWYQADPLCTWNSVIQRKRQYAL
jgi:hypothetical protein